MKRNEICGKIYNILYINTDLEEKLMEELCIKIFKEIDDIDFIERLVSEQ